MTELTFEEKAKTANELYKSQNFFEAIELFEELRSLDEVAFEKSQKFTYMWALFRGQINNEYAFDSKNEKRTQEAIRYIINHSTNTEQIYQSTVIKVVKYLSKKGSYNAEKINVWLDKLEPSILSDETKIYKGEDGRKVVYLSPKEVWYSQKTKSLEKLEQFDECERYCNEALAVLNEFNYSNDMWFKRRIALAKHSRGETNDAINMLLVLIKTKPDWFMLSDLCTMYFSLGNLDNAFKYGIEAASKSMDDEFKVRLFWLIADILELRNETTHINLFKSYSLKLRTDKDWKIPEDQLDFYLANEDKILATDIFSYKRQLKAVLESLKWGDTPRETGKISMINQEKKFGYIQTKDQSYYFRFQEFKSSKYLIRVGVDVGFYLVEGFDKKKNQVSLNAVEIRQI